MDDMWRRLVFFGGDVRRLETFPWATWAVEQKKVCYEELLDALSHIQYGDIGLHRDSGYLSNLAIPGFMKHAWIHVQDGTVEPVAIEAVSEGVVRRSPLYPMFSDYVIILAPKDVTDESRKGACLKAEGIVGVRYDHNFEFDIERELAHYRGVDEVAAADDLKRSQQWIGDYDHGFSCTEVVAYAWWHEREKLRIYRHEYNGKSVITADTFLHGSWEIRWASQSVTVDAAAKMGLSEEGVELIRQWKK